MSHIRKLAAEEIEKLAFIEDGFVPDPEQSISIVAEDKGQIVGRMLLIRPWHIEGTWVHPEYRGGTVGARLMYAMEEEAQRMEITNLFAYVDDVQNEEYMKRLGFSKREVTVWVKEL